MKILITGASGFIGSHLGLGLSGVNASAKTELAHEVHGTFCNSEPADEIRRCVSLHRLDLGDEAAVKALV
ncbi:MAG: NAD(P)-dependent oxidoreductase, partial [Bdellovibrionales bacterium]|nr:NAD(P)-dependent oxidoreductase [Bdellovibrionales bacterium]